MASHPSLYNPGSGRRRIPGSTGIIRPVYDPTKPRKAVVRKTIDYFSNICRTIEV